MDVYLTAHGEISHIDKSGYTQESFCDRWRKPRGYRAFVFGFALIALTAATGLLVYHTGGTGYVLVHLMYIPILLGAAAFREVGGVLTACLAGLVLGPFMPLDVEQGIPQGLANWWQVYCRGGSTKNLTEPNTSHDLMIAPVYPIFCHSKKCSPPHSMAKR